jgi:predicted nucleic acid-binding protein
VNTLNFLDANVWLAPVCGRHIYSERAREWLEKAREEKFVFCRFKQVTVLRLLTSTAVMGNVVRKMREAWDLWDNVCSDDRVAYLAEPEASWSGEGILSEHPMKFSKVMVKRKSNRINGRLI